MEILVNREEWHLFLDITAKMATKQMDLPMRILYIDHLVFVAMDYNHRDSYRRKNRIADHGSWRSTRRDQQRQRKMDQNYCAIFEKVCFLSL